MADKPSLKQALDTVMSLTYPPTTLTIATGKAAGHRLAKSVVAKGNQPSRPVSTVDGLAVIAGDIVDSELNAAPPESTDGDNGYDEHPAEPSRSAEEHEDDGRVADDLEDLAHFPLDDDDNGELYEAEPEDDRPPVEATATLELRPFPASNRKEDALGSGQAIPVPVGGEVPRGGEIIFPLADLVNLPEEEEEEAGGDAEDPAAGEAPEPDRDQPAKGGNGKSANGRNGKTANGGNGKDANGDDDDDLPVTEPPRTWDLPGRFSTGTVDLPRYARRPARNMVPIGAWARNRDVLIPEKTVLRPADMAMLLALGVEEVSIYRRPVVGVVSLGEPFPVAGHQQDREAPKGVCPASIMANSLARAARVAALPLGFAPKRYHQLTAAVERWVQQVDILLLVGGSHHGTHCRGRDVIRTLGRVQLSGADIRPGGNLTTGKVNGQPVIALPGSLPDVLAGFVLLVRPLLHKYLIPHQYEDRFDLRLENGSRLRAGRDTAVPVRFGFERDEEVFTTRYSGRPAEDWLDYIRGQALIVLEGGRSYSDGEVIKAYRY